MLLLILISFPTVCVLLKEKNGEIFRAVYLWLLSRKLLEPLSNEDMILTLAGQFKQLSREPEKFR